MWPGYPKALPLVHFIACLTLWGNTKMRELRGLYYPSKKNSFYPLDHILIDSKSLCDIAGQIYRSKDKAATVATKESLVSKAVLFYGVRSVRKKFRDEVLCPSINEIMPHFSKNTKDDLFESYSGHFYAHIKAKLQGAAKRALVERNYRTLGDPGKAPDGVFALGYKLTREDEHKALREIQKTATPDVLLLDGTWGAVRGIPDWRRRFVALIHDAEKVFGDKSPGILIVTDNPRQTSWLNAYIEKTDPELSRKMQFHRHGILYPSVSHGLTEPDSEAKPVLSESKIRVFVTDSEIGNIVETSYTVIKRLEDKRIDATPLRNAVKFLAKLSHLPGTIDKLWDYLNSKNVDVPTRTKFDWNSYLNSLNAFVGESGLAGEAILLRPLIKQAQRMVEAYEKGTPLGLKVLHELRTADENNKKTFVVVRGPLHRAVLSKYLETNGAGSPDAIVLVDELDEVLRSEQVDSIIFADMNPAILRTLFSNPLLPPNIVSILTSPMAQELKYTLAPLLQIADFGVFHERISQILTLLESGLQQNGRSLIEDIGFSSPSFRLHTYDDDTDPDLEEKDVIYIGLEGGRTLRRGKHSQVYVYEPRLHDNAGIDFREVLAENIQVGQDIFLMSGDLREEIGDALKKYGVGGSGRDAPCEIGLREYHAYVSEQISKIYGGTGAEQLRRIKQIILKTNPNLESELNNMKYWVNLEKSAETSFAELSPQAPQRFRAFKAFCGALEIPENSINLFWTVIQCLRGFRRGDGRILSDVYSRILFQPESAAIYTQMPEEVIARLRQKAVENTYTVTEAVHGVSGG
jgi:hypothetical protein